MKPGSHSDNGEKYFILSVELTEFVGQLIREKGRSQRYLKMVGLSHSKNGVIIP